MSVVHPVHETEHSRAALRRGTHHPLTDIKNSLYAPLMASILDIFRALADPTRLRIIYLLRSMELAVGEIAQVVGQSQPRVSRHVRILVEAGLAERRKEGSWVFLRLGQDAHIAPLTRFLDGAGDRKSTSELQSLMRISYDVFCL